jgi:uncharacterized delta-60 repeat protein
LLATWPLDATFGNVVINGFVGEAQAVALQTVGTTQYLVMGGYVKCTPGSGGYCDSTLHGNADWAVIRINARTGAQDMSFGTNGGFTEDWDNLPANENSVDDPVKRERINGVAIDSQNRNVVVGFAYSDNSSMTHAVESFVVMRIEPDGKRLDQTFNRANGGKQFVGFFQSPNGEVCAYWRQNVATAVVLDPPTGSNQKIVIAGWAREEGVPRPSTLPYFAVARLNDDGSHDTTFGDSPCSTDSVTVEGIKLINFDAESRATALARTSDGEFVLAGTRAPRTGHSDFAVAKLTANGQPVAAFGRDGKQTVDVNGGSADTAQAVVLQRVPVNGTPTDFVLVGGSSGSDFALARLRLDDGALDTANFGGTTAHTGTVVYDSGGRDGGQSLLLNDGEKPLIGGFSASGAGPEVFAGARFAANGDGSVPDCGASCTFQSDFSPAGPAKAYAMDREADGRTAVVGYTSDAAGNRHMAAILLCPDPATDCNTGAPAGGVAPDAAALLAGAAARRPQAAAGAPGARTAALAAPARPERAPTLGAARVVKRPEAAAHLKVAPRTPSDLSWEPFGAGWAWRPAGVTLR